MAEGELNEDNSFSLTRLEFNITSKCNLNCCYCANDFNLMSSKTLSLETMAHIMDRVGPEIVNFTGGEPTLERVLVPAIQAAKERGIIVQLDTHATTLTTRRIDDLVVAGVDRFHVSYSTTREKFREIRGVPKRLFHNLQRNLRHIAAIPSVELLCEAVLSTENYKDFPRLYKEVVDIGADEFQVQPLLPFGRADYKMLLPPGVMTEVIEGLYAIEDPRTPLKIWCSYITRCSPYADRVYKEERSTNKAIQSEQGRKQTGLSTGCLEGWTRLHIHNNGDVLICDLVNWPAIGNVYEKDILDIYNDTFLREVRATKPEACESCEYWHSCHNVCPATAFNMTGNLRTRFWDLYKLKDQQPIEIELSPKEVKIPPRPR
ncbi:radical SAM protein [Candidatus Woesearchaeota archaeon]|nr:radical SAM protein [Candidatus Woesearchaeota archaeon]